MKRNRGLNEALGLPRDLAASLGRMIARHSLLEDKLAKCLYRLAGVNFKIGRVALANPRGSEVLGHMQEVAQIIGADLLVSQFPWNAYKIKLDELKTKRDTFAHSVWLVDSDTKKYVLVVTKGKWPAPQNRPGMSRRIHPEPRPVTPSDLRLLRKEIENAIKKAETLDRLIQNAPQLLGHASPRKSS